MYYYKTKMYLTKFMLSMKLFLVNFFKHANLLINMLDNYIKSVLTLFLVKLTRFNAERLYSKIFQKITLNVILRNILFLKIFPNLY